MTEQLDNILHKIQDDGDTESVNEFFDPITAGAVVVISSTFFMLLLYWFSRATVALLRASVDKTYRKCMAHANRTAHNKRDRQVAYRLCKYNTKLQIFLWI